MKLNLDELEKHKLRHAIDSDYQLSKAMGVASSTVYRAKSGELTPGAEFIAGLRRAFPNCDLNKLLIP